MSDPARGGVNPIYERCCCTWEPFGESGGKAMKTRNVDCELHGDDTGWWGRTKAQAAELAVRHHAEDSR